jgi:hypothetical protein
LNPFFSKKNISASTIRYRRAEVSAKVLLSMVLFKVSKPDFYISMNFYHLIFECLYNMSVPVRNILNSCLFVSIWQNQFIRALLATQISFPPKSFFLVEPSIRTDLFPKPQGKILDKLMTRHTQIIYIRSYKHRVKYWLTDRSSSLPLASFPPLTIWFIPPYSPLSPQDCESLRSVSIVSNFVLT